MEHFIQSYFQSVFHNFPFADIKIIPVSDGWLAVLLCKKTMRTYKFKIEEIKSSIEVLTVDSLLEKGGIEI